MNSNVTVSCIMPTCNRRPFVQKAIEYFSRQDYQNKELVIVDDGTDPIADLLPENGDLKYIRLKTKTALGEKRNIAIENTKGEIILHWDDDDWYARNRISYQVHALIGHGASLCGLGNGLYYDVIENQFWRCKEALHNELFYAGIIGGSICYLKSLWHQLDRFPSSRMLAEDSIFLRKLPCEIPILKLSNKNILVYIRHNANTWRFQCGHFITPEDWIRIDDQDVISEWDLSYYRNLH